MRKSFKKGMAMLLAAAMVFSTPVAVSKTTVKAAAEPTVVTGSSTTEDVVDCLTGFFTGFSNYYKATGNFEATFNMTLQGAVKAKDEAGNDVYQNWFAPLLVVTSDANRSDPGKDGYYEYAVRRADQYGWGDAKDGTTMKKDWFTADADNGIEKATDWASWFDMVTTVGTKYSINIKRISNKITVTYGMEADGKKYSMIEEIQYSLPGTIRMFLSGENNKYTINSYTYKEVEGIADALLGAAKAELSEDGKSINLNYSTKMSIPAEDLSIKVNGVEVASGSAVSATPVSGAATYVYTPKENGKYTFAVAAKERTVNGTLYLGQEVTTDITVVKDGDRFYVQDDTLFTDFGVSETKTDKVFKIDWTAAAGVTATVKVTDKDGKQVGTTLSAPGNVTVPAVGGYTAEIVAKKDTSIKTGSIDFECSAAPPADQTKTDKFSKITAPTVFKSTFDSADSAAKDGVNMTGSKAKIANGIITFAPSAGYTAKKDAADRKGDGNQYFAKLPSLSAKDFSKGMTFIMDVNVKEHGEWTSVLTLGNGKLNKALENNGDVGYHYTLGLSSVLDYNDQSASVKTGKIGYYGGGQHVNDKKDGMKEGVCLPKAPYAYDWFAKAENRNKWYTLAVTISENGTMTTYFNGEAIQTNKDDSYKEILKAMKKASNNYLGVGYWSHLGDSDFAGSMDDVAIYNTALSAADIKKLNRTGTTGVTPPKDDPKKTAKVSKVSIKVPNRKAGKTIYVKKGDKVTLKATVTGTGSYSKSVTWKSSKTKVATVKNGKVTAKKAGTAKITATSKTDKTKKATITIKVSKKAVKNKKLKISPAKKSLKKGKSLTIKIKKMTKKTTDKITYKSSKKSVATVDAYGKVKAKKKGKATITVKCGKKKAKLKLTVKK